MKLKDKLNLIQGLNLSVAKEIGERFDNQTKPLGSLGRLEDMVKRLGAITGEVHPNIKNKTVIIMCADNGVTDEGVSSCPKSVTATVTKNFTKGFTAINTFTRYVGAEIDVVDIGVDEDINCDGVLNRKIRKGTDNMAKGPAMSRGEAIKAIEVGIDEVKRLKESGVNLLGTGEMGIGNTSTSSAVAAVLTGKSIEHMVGFGSGLTKEAYRNKIEVIKRGIEVNNPKKDDPIDVISKVGGLDIAGLVGCFLGAAICRVPIVIDGFISAASALAAVRICPKVIDFIFPSHGSAEPGNKIIMEALKLKPYLDLGMRLGEGTGAAVEFKMMDMAIYAYENIGTFKDAGIKAYKKQI